MYCEKPGLTACVLLSVQAGQNICPELTGLKTAFWCVWESAHFFLLYSAVLIQRIAPRKVQITMMVAGISDA